MTALLPALLALALAADTPAPGAPLAPDTAPAPEGRTSTHPGWTAMYAIRQLTIVYPAGPGEDAAAGARQARRIADFLSARHGHQVAVTGDGEVGPEALAGNLLVLGWGNRLLDPGGKAPRPFARGEALAFLGREFPEKGADLLFAAESPFAEKRLLFFWSRRDPELERMMPLPAVGSDWAVLRGLTVLAQGMFQVGPPWPPRADENAEADHRQELARRRAERSVRTSDHWVVLVPPEVPAEEASRILKARETALARAAEGLGAIPEGFRVTLTVYADPEAKREESGMADPVHSLPRERELHALRPAARSPSSHEEVHLLARALLGPTVHTVLYEGLAVARDGSFQGTGLELQAAILLDRGAVPALDVLLDEARAANLPDDVRFPLSALVVRWIEAAGGRPALQAAWSAPDLDVAALGRALGLADPQAAFGSWLGQRAAERAPELAFLKLQEQARKRHLAHDYAGLVDVLQQALAIRPGDPQTLFNLSGVRIRLKDYAGARADLARILEQASTLAPADRHLEAFAHYQLGRIHDLLGEREQALQEYRTVLALPDRYDSHRVAREGLAAPFTEDRLD